MKTNIDYLRELIEDNTEAVEFLDAIEKEFDESKDEIERLKLLVADTDELEAANERIEELEEFEPNYTFEGIGKIYIRCDNLADQSIIESLTFKRL